MASPSWWIPLIFALCQVSTGAVVELDNKNVAQEEPLPVSILDVVEPLISPPVTPLAALPLVSPELVQEADPKAVETTTTENVEPHNESILWTVADTPAPEVEPEKIVLTLEPTTTGENQLYRTADGKVVRLIEHGSEIIERGQKCFSYFIPSKSKEPEYIVKTPADFRPPSGLLPPPPPPEMSASSFAFPPRRVVSAQQLRRLPPRPISAPSALRYPPVYRHHLIDHVDDIRPVGVTGIETPVVKVVKKSLGSDQVETPVEVKKEEEKNVKDEVLIEKLSKSGPVQGPTSGKTMMRNKGRWFWSSSYYDPYDYDYYDYGYGPYQQSDYYSPWYNPYYYKSMA